jgi:hydroxymethylpyrimidine pyrophosphatase-like HAD family hydrolase
MKSKNLFFISLALFFPIALNSCKEDSDTTKPVINLIEPFEDNVLQIGNEHGVHFEAEFSDNEGLSSYKVDIHPNFDGHVHTRANETVDFKYNKSWSITGKNTVVHHHEIQIPENATPGNYHLMVYCTDNAGNESHVAVNIELNHEAGEFFPH